MPFALSAEGIRVATLHAELTRKGPGVLLRDIQREKDKQLTALKEIVTAVDPDVLLLTKVDFDLERRAAKALQSYLGFAHSLAVKPNSMMPTELDLDGDGQSGDRQTWARFAGEGAMLLLSKQPVHLQFHLNDVLWKDVPSSDRPVHRNGTPYPSKAAQDAQKLIGQGLWVIKVDMQDEAEIILAAFQNQTPVFDGPEDMNGLRGRAQLQMLDAIRNNKFGEFPSQRFALIGNANLDPKRGEGDRAAIATLLSDPRLQDPIPKSALGGDATAMWENPGPMRVSYILPSRDWIVEQAEVFWPDQGPLRLAAERASRHRMIWMDIRQRP